MAIDAQQVITLMLPEWYQAVIEDVPLAPTLLLDKMMEIERRLRAGQCDAALSLVMEAEEDVLELERQLIEALRHNNDLRRAA